MLASRSTNSEVPDFVRSETREPSTARAPNDFTRPSGRSPFIIETVMADSGNTIELERFYDKEPFFIPAQHMSGGIGSYRPDNRHSCLLRRATGYKDLVNPILPRMASDVFSLGYGIPVRKLYEVEFVDVEMVWNGNVASQSNEKELKKSSTSLSEMSDDSVVSVIKKVKARGVKNVLRVEFELKGTKPICGGSVRLSGLIASL